MPIRSHLLAFAILLSAMSASAGRPNYNLMFQVDLSQVGTIEPTVSVAGNFQALAGYPADWTPGMTVLSHVGDDVYSITVSVPPGSYEFRYINGSNWGQEESVPGACAVNGNRIVTVTGDTVLEPVCFSECAPCVPPVQDVTVLLQVDMTGQVVSADASVAGDFQAVVVGESWSAWTPGLTQIEDPEGDGVYSRLVTIPEDSYRLIFLTGGVWGTDESVPVECAVAGTRELVVSGPGPMAMPITCFSSCSPCNALFLDGAEIGSLAFWSATVGYQ